VLVQQRKKEKQSKSWRVSVASEISQLLLLLKARCCIVERFVNWQCILLSRSYKSENVASHIFFRLFAQIHKSHNPLVPTLTQAFLLHPTMHTTSYLSTWTVNPLGRRLANLSFRRNSIHGFFQIKNIALMSAGLMKSVQFAQKSGFTIFSFAFLVGSTSANSIEF